MIGGLSVCVRVCVLSDGLIGMAIVGGAAVVGGAAAVALVGLGLILNKKSKK